MYAKLAFLLVVTNILSNAEIVGCSTEILLSMTVQKC